MKKEKQKQARIHKKETTNKKHGNKAETKQDNKKRKTNKHK